MQEWLIEAGVRLIQATRLVDKLYWNFDRARSALVLACASDAVLARFNSVAYGGIDPFHPESPAFRRYLFAWEEEVVATYFPPPPARLLIGGAGGGREALTLAERGYEVVAFEPSARLAAAMARQIREGMNLRAYRADYEDLPRLFPAEPEKPGGNLEVESNFDAAILGWCSYSHLRTQEQRIRTLSSFARCVRGAILVSFIRFVEEEAPPTETWRKRVRELLKIRTGDRFSTDFGFTHDECAKELTAEADQSGLTIVHLEANRRAISWPYAVLRPVDLVGARALPQSVGNR